MLKFAVDARAQRGGLVSELIAFLGCQSISLILKPRFHGVDFLQRFADVNVLSHWLPTTLRLVWCPHIVMFHGFFDSRVIDGLFVNHGSINPAILLLLCLGCALSLVRHHCLLATFIFIKFYGGRCSLIFRSTRPFLNVAVGGLNVANRVLR